VVWVQLSYHLHDLCAVAEDPAALFDYGQVVARHEGELPHAHAVVKRMVLVVLLLAPKEEVAVQAGPGDLP
jgi:hypothetical protein